MFLFGLSLLGNRFCLYFIFFLKKCSKQKMLFYQDSHSSLKRRKKRQIPGEKNVESSAIVQTAISVFHRRIISLWDHHAHNHAFKWESLNSLTMSLWNEELAEHNSLSQCSSSLLVPPLLSLSVLTSAGSNWLAPVCAASFLSFSRLLFQLQQSMAFCFHVACPINPQTEKHHGVSFNNLLMVWLSEEILLTWSKYNCMCTIYHHIYLYFAYSPGSASSIVFLSIG